MYLDLSSKRRVLRFDIQLHNRTDGWITQFYVLFNSVSIISGRWTCDNEKLCAVEFNMNGYTFRESNFYIISFASLFNGYVSFIFYVVSFIFLCCFPYSFMFPIGANLSTEDKISC